MASIEWFRLWHDMPNDPKWRTVARVSGQPIATVLAVALHLMVDASRNVTRGHVSVTAEDVASALDVTDEAVEAILSAMQGRVLDGDRLSGWDKRQPKREDLGDPGTGAKSAAERKRAQREREKQAHEADWKGVDGACHAVSRDVTLDTDKDTDKEIPTNQRASAPDPVPPKPQAPPPEEPQKSSSDPMPMRVCWQPSGQFHAMAKLAGLPPQDGQQFADGLAEFIAFWLTKPEEERTQSQWDHALVKSMQGRKVHSAGRQKPPAKADVSASAGRDLLPAWRRDEIRRQFEATPNLVPADLLPQIGIDPATRRPFARPAQGVTIIENIPLEIAHEPASRLG